MNDQQNRQNTGGSGSAENIDQSRENQKHAPTNLSENEKNDIANEIGSGNVPVVSLRDLGATSGRDDASGGSGDQMETTSSNEPTDKF